MTRDRWPTNGQVALALGGITAVALALRWPLMGDSLFSDELSTHFIVASGRSLGEAMDVIRTDQEVSPPLFFLLAWATEGIGGLPESLRWIPLLAGLASVPLTYGLGAWASGRYAGLLAAVLVAISPFMIAYSTQARGYILAMALGLGSTLCLVRAVDRGGAGWWIGYALCSAAAMYVHYTIAFVLAAQLAWALWYHRSAWRWLLGANLAAALTYVPWLAGFEEDLNGLNQIPRVNPFSFSSMIDDLERGSIGTPGFGLEQIPGAFGAALIVIGVLLAAAAWALPRAGLGRAAWRPSAPVVLIAALAISTPAGLILSSIAGDDVLYSRNLIGSWPAFAVGIAAIVTAAAGPARIAAAALVLVGFGIGAVKVLQNDNRTLDYDAVAELIEDRSAARAVVIDRPLGATPTSATEVALADPGEPYPSDERVVRLAAPTLPTQIRGQAGGTSPIDLPVPLEARTVSRAARLARDGELYVVLLGSHDPRLRREASDPVSLLAPLDALPPGFRQVDHHEVPGGLQPITVYELRDQGRDK